MSNDVSKTAKGLRPLIGPLKERPQSKAELIKILQAKDPKVLSDTIRKRVERKISDLEYLGLVQERGDKYCWYIYNGVFKNPESYSAKLQHSNLLIPALREIAGITWSERVALIHEKSVVGNDRDLLVQYAKDHLRVYPEIWDILASYQRLSAEAGEKTDRFITKLKDKLREKFREEPIVESISALKRGIAVDNISKRLCYELVHETPLDFTLNNGELYFNGTFVAKGAKTLTLPIKVKKVIQDEFFKKSNIETAIKISNIERKAFEIKPLLEQEIHKRILKVESGEPLAGRCDGCPTVHFAS